MFLLCIYFWHYFCYTFYTSKNNSYLEEIVMGKQMVALLAGAMLMMATSAMAIPTLTLSDGVVTKVIEDGSSLDADGALDGNVTFVGAVGSTWLYNVSTGIFGAVPGTPAMDLNTADTSGKCKTKTRPAVSGVGTLTITFSELVTDAWTGPGATTHVGGTLLTGTGNNVKFETRINGVSQDIMSFQQPGVSFSGDSSFSYNATGHDLIEMIATIHHEGFGTTSFDYALNPVPEPGTMMLLGFGMLGLAVYGKRRMNKEA
jgi:hypothetical protein